MTQPPTTDRISDVQARQSPGGLWRITFRSDNPARHHQLYVGGALAAWTDTADERQFVVAPPQASAQAVIVAVDAADRHKDLVPFAAEEAPAQWKAAVLADAALTAAVNVAVMGDHATGTEDPLPIASVPLWPAWAPAWAFGQDNFGDGAFGYGGSHAPGLGAGAFGQGPFGLDCRVVQVTAPLPEEGAHQLRLMSVDSRGRQVLLTAATVLSMPPPPPAAAVQVISYDPVAARLTINIQ